MKPTLYLILVNPEIPPNTGNIIRLCANVGAHLHLVRPLGFSLDDATLRRAGMDYRQMANVKQYDTLDDATAMVKETRLFALAPRHAEDKDDRVGGVFEDKVAGGNVEDEAAGGIAEDEDKGVGGYTRYDKPQYQQGDGFVLGCESKGLPQSILKTFPQSRRLYIPMLPNNRSINLSNTAAIIATEAWRHQNYQGTT